MSTLNFRPHARLVYLIACTHTHTHEYHAHKLPPAIITHRRRKEADVLVDVLVVQLIHHGDVDVPLQIGQVHYHAGDRIARAAHRHQQLVVVPMAVRIVALAVHLSVGVVAEQRAAIASRHTHTHTPVIMNATYAHTVGAIATPYLCSR